MSYEFIQKYDVEDNPVLFFIGFIMPKKKFTPKTEDFYLYFVDKRKNVF